MASKELVIGGVTIGERDYFPEAKGQLNGDILAFLASVGGMELPDPSQVQANKGIVQQKSHEQETNYLSAHLKNTLTHIPGMDNQKIKSKLENTVYELSEIAVEAKKRKDLPEDFVDRVAAHYLLEMASTEAKSTFDLSVLVEMLDSNLGERRTLTEKQAEMLFELTKAKGQIKHSEKWLHKYAPAVKAFAQDLSEVGVGIWQGNNGETYLDEIKNVFTSWEDKLQKRGTIEIGDIVSETITKTFKQYSDSFSEQLIPDLDAGKNGKAMRNRIEDFAINATYARDLVSTDAMRKKSGIELYALAKKLSPYKNGMYSAMLLVGWHEGVAGLPRDSKGNQNVVESKVSVGNERYLYLHDMVEHVDRKVIDSIGALLTHAKNPRSLEMLLSQNADDKAFKVIRDWPMWALSRVADSFADAGYVSKMSSGLYKLKKDKGQYVSSLDYDSLRSVALAHKFMYSGKNKKPEIKGISSLKQIYERNNQLIKIDKLDFDVPRAKIDFLSKVEIGYEDLDAEFIERKIEELRKKDPADRPAVIVLSDVIFGTFLITKKSKRLTLADGMNSLDTQFALAKELVDQFLELGIKVVVMKGSDGWDLADNQAVKAVQRLQKKSASLAGLNEQFIDYHDADVIRQSETYDKNLQFQWNVIFPYCLRMGRSLMNADEVADKTGGEVKIEEYLLLQQIYDLHAIGEPIPQEYLQVVDLSQIPFKDKVFKDELYIVDDAIVTLNPTDGTKPFVVSLWERFANAPATLMGNPISALKIVANEAAATGREKYDLTVTTSQMWGTGVGTALNTMVASTPGTHTYNADKQGSHRRATGNSTHRQMMRGTPPVASSNSFEKGRGHTIVEFESKLIYDKSYATPPSAVVLVQDLQIGGDTARLDLIPKYFDYIMTQVAPVQDTYWGFNGDITHGVNFPGAAISNAPTRLNSTAKQNELGRDLFEASLGHFNAQELANIKKWMNLPGNHQWNTKTRDTGELYIQWIEDLVKGRLRSAYGPSITEAELRRRVKTYQTMQTADGDLMLDAWTAIEPIGEVGLMMQHLILDKMAKGGGDIPVFQFKNFINGVGELAAKTDISLYGHWHHKMWMQLGHKVAGVGPALAGQSYYEWKLGYRPQIGALIVRFGGGKPVSFDYIDARALYNHKIQDGAFSPAALADEGFVTDKEFIPGQHGFGGLSNGPKDAVQKKIWSMINRINDQPSSFVGTEVERWDKPY